MNGIVTRVVQYLKVGVLLIVTGWVLSLLSIHLLLLLPILYNFILCKFDQQTKRKSICLITILIVEGIVSLQLIMKTTMKFGCFPLISESQLVFSILFSTLFYTIIVREFLTILKSNNETRTKNNLEE